MKNTLILLFLLTLPVYALEKDEFQVPYCKNRISFNCRIKDSDYKKWYSENTIGFINYQLMNNKTNEIMSVSFEEPIESYIDLLIKSEEIFAEYNFDVIQN